MRAGKSADQPSPRFAARRGNQRTDPLLSLPILPYYYLLSHLAIEVVSIDTQFILVFLCSRGKTYLSDSVQRNNWALIFFTFSLLFLSVLLLLLFV